MDDFDFKDPNILSEINKLPKEEQDKIKNKLIFLPLDSPQELRAWVHLFFDIYFPSGVVYPTSTHGPIEAMWEIYRLLKTGESQNCPQTVMLASRDSFKTLSAAALEVLCMLHFRMPVAHMAAIKSQSAKAIQYVNSFFRKVSPYLEHHGWSKKSDSKTYIEWTTEKGETIYLNVVTATMSGSNSEHVPLLCVDGSTNILCKNKNVASNRIRKNKTARGIYNAIKKGNTVEVYTFNHAKGTFEFKPVLKAFKQKKIIYEISFEDQTTLKVSEDHPLCDVYGNYKPLKDFKIGDSVLKINKKQLHTLKITNIKPLDYRDAFDFTVQDNHNFFANQILVHNCIDEVDLVQDPRALKEAKMIPSTFKHYFPLTVYLSTRKFAGGLMEKTIDDTIKAGGKILRWNIVDVAERITTEDARVHEPKVVRYVSRDLPMENLTPEQYEKVLQESKYKYEKVELYAGIAEHPLAPIMRNYLVDRNQEDVGDLYKPVISVLNNFKTLISEPDTASAQLLCNQPSSSGLVYPRFDKQKNLITVKELLKKILDEDNEIDSFEYLKDAVKNLGLEVIGGGDWGHTDYTVLVVMLQLPGGAWVVLDTLSLQGLELSDIVKYGTEFQNDWNVSKWYVDQNYPSYLKTLRRPQKEDGTGGAGWSIPEFKKVVTDGITALQGKIVNASNQRKFFILDTPNNQQVINAFGEYRWALDGKGNIIEGVPYHDKEGISDIMDALRYPAQNRFMTAAKKGIMVVSEETKTQSLQKVISKDATLQEMARALNSNTMQQTVKTLSNESTAPTQPKKKGGPKIVW